MSTTVDNRVVEMEFDNDQFEKGVHQTLGTLEQLKQSLEFENSSLSGIENDLNTLTSRFSNMGVVGLTVLQDLTRGAERMATALVKDVALDPITTGWQKYADKTTAVQTVMAATADQFDDTGKQMEYVNGQLEKLNWFTDETSYNFVDMVGNIGKFTASGVKLDDAVTAMIGIANWAAVSGQNAQTASRAMYQLSQAMGSGVIKLMDWRSIINANMATVEFKNTVLETAASMGTLEKAADGTYRTLNGNLVDTISFAEHLTDDEWFTGDVLIGALDKYGRFTNELYDISQEAKNANKTTSELIAELEKGGQVTDQFGLKAFRTAQEAKTFAEAIDSVKDAASTGWMTLYEDVFGDYLSAKKIWTELANYLWDVFVGPIARVHELLVEWIGKGGRDAFLEALESIGPAIDNILAPLADAWSNVFTFDGSGLVRFSENLRDFIQSIQWTEEEAQALQIVFEAIFTVLKGISKIAGSVLRVAWQGLMGVFSIAQKIFDLIAKGIIWVNDLVEKIIEMARNSESLQNTISGFKMIFGGIAKGLETIWNALNQFIEETGLLEFVHKTFSKAFEIIGNAILEATDIVLNFPSKVREAIQDFVKAFFGIEIQLPTITDMIMAVGGAISKFVEWLDKGKQKIKDFLTGFEPITNRYLPNVVKQLKKIQFNTAKITDYILSGFSIIGGALAFAVEGVKTAINSIMDLFYKLVSAITGTDYTTFKASMEGILGSVFDVIKGIYESIKNVVKDLFDTFGKSGEDIPTWDKLKVFVANLKNDVSPLTDSLDRIVVSVRAFFDKMFGIDTTPGERIVLFFEKLRDAITGVFGGLITIGQKLVAIVKEIFQKLYDFVGQPTLPEVIEMVKNFTSILLALSVPKTLKQVGNTFEQLSLLFSGLRKKIAAGTLKEIAEAILILAGAMAILSLIPQDKLTNSVAVVIGLITVLGLLTKKITQWSKSLSGLGQATISTRQLAVLLVGMAGAVFILSSALKQVGNVQNLEMGFVVIAALLLEVYGIMKELSKVQFQAMKLKTVFGYLLIVGGIVEAVRKVIESLAPLMAWPTDRILAATLGAAAIVATMAVLMIAINRLTTTIKTDRAANLAAMAQIIGSFGTALLMIAGAAKLISMIPEEDMGRVGKTLAIFGGAILALFAIFMLLTKLGNNVAGFKDTGKDFVKIAGSFVILGLSLITLAAGLALFTLVPWDGIKKGLLVLAALLAGLSLFGLLIGGVSVIGNGVKIITNALFKIGVGLLALVTSIYLFVAASALLTTSVGTIAAGFIALGTAVIAALLALMPALTVVIIAGIASVCTAIVGSAGTILAAIISLLAIIQAAAPILGFQVGMILNEVLIGIAAALPAIIDTLFKLVISAIYGLADALRGNTGALMDALKSLVEAIFEALIQAIGKIFTLNGGKLWSKLFGIDIDGNAEVQNAAESMRGVFGVTGDEGTDYINNLSADIKTASQSPNVKADIDAAGQNILGGIKDTFSSDNGYSAAQELMSGTGEYFASDQAMEDSNIGMLPDSINKSLISRKGTFAETGSLLTTGLGEGISSKLGDISNISEELGSTSLDSLTSVLNIRSPSRKTEEIGRNYDQGFINGMQNDRSKIINAVNEIAKKALEALRVYISQFNQVGKDCSTGFAQGLRNNVSTITSAGTYIGDAALKAAKKAVDSNSPAKKFIQLGKDSDTGLAMGLLRYSKEVTAAGGQVASVALTSLQSALRNMGTLIDDNMDLNPVITPVLDLKNIQNGTNALGQMLNFTPRTALSYAGVAAGTNYSGINTTVNMTIYGAEGQDVNVLADIISHKIDTKVMRRQNTWR